MSALISRMVRTTQATIVMGSLLLAVSASGTLSDLARFLAEVEDAGQAPNPARADIRISVKDPASGERTYEGVAIYRGGDVYLELRDPPIRGLILGEDSQIRFTAAAPSATSVHDPISSTTLIADDFRPFRANVLRLPQIASETRRTLLVSGAPTEASRYVLIVYQIDRDKHRPIRVQYYERTLNNLVRMRFESELVRVGGVWRPGKSDIQDYRTGTETTIEFRWTPDAEIPAGLFADRGSGSTPALLTKP